MNEKAECYAYIENDNIEKQQKIEKYKKISYHKFSLVFDIKDFFIEIVDPEQEKNLPVS